MCRYTVLEYDMVLYYLYQLPWNCMVEGSDVRRLSSLSFLPWHSFSPGRCSASKVPQTAFTLAVHSLWLGGQVDRSWQRPGLVCSSASIIAKGGFFIRAGPSQVSFSKGAASEASGYPVPKQFWPLHGGV